MENAGKELLEHAGDREVEFVRIAYRKSYSDKPTVIEGGMTEVLPHLNFMVGKSCSGIFGTWTVHGLIVANTTDQNGGSIKSDQSAISILMYNILAKQAHKPVLGNIYLVGALLERIVSLNYGR